MKSAIRNFNKQRLSLRRYGGGLYIILLILGVTSPTSAENFIEIRRLNVPISFYGNSFGLPHPIKNWFEAPLVLFERSTVESRENSSLPYISVPTLLPNQVEDSLKIQFPILYLDTLFPIMQHRRRKFYYGGQLWERGSPGEKKENFAKFEMILSQYPSALREVRKSYRFQVLQIGAALAMTVMTIKMFTKTIKNINDLNSDLFPDADFEVGSVINISVSGLLFMISTIRASRHIKRGLTSFNRFQCSNCEQFLKQNYSNRNFIFIM